jgi:K+-transporting ATPase ATPase C chain
MNRLLHQFRPAVLLLLAMTLITGVVYPGIVTAIAQVAFPSQANGSMIVVDGQTVGSSLIGQSFDDPKYFWVVSPPPARTARTRAARRAPTSGRRARP